MENAWPELHYEDWAPTKKTLQMCSQILGKTRLALAPPQPEWLNACLYLDARGFTTGAMPVGERVACAGIDLFDSTMWVTTSDGRRSEVKLGSGKCVADVWNEYTSASAELGIEAPLWEKPQELDDTTSFSANRHDCTLDSVQAQRFHRLLCTIDGVFEEFRAQFFGRSSIQFWWGAFDFAVLLFTGEKLVAPDDKGYIMRYDLDAVHLNAGFWPGDDNAPGASFYGYLVPRPDGCETAPIRPSHASWVEAMGEWILPYDAVRECDDPRKALLDFLGSVYEVAVTLGGWDAEAFEYTPPAPAARG